MAFLAQTSSSAGRTGTEELADFPAGRAVDVSPIGDAAEAPVTEEFGHD